MPKEKLKIRRSDELEQLEGKWKQYSGKAKEKWKTHGRDLPYPRPPRSTDRQKSERYGIAKQEAENRLMSLPLLPQRRRNTRKAPRRYEADVHSNAKEKKRGAGQS